MPADEWVDRARRLFPGLDATQHVLVNAWVRSDGEGVRVQTSMRADHFLDGALAVKSETLWLQTSTGPGGQYPKLQVVAEPVFEEGATHAQAHPKAHPVNCA